MHKNFIWQAFLLIVFLATLWYTVIATYRYYSYIRLTAKTTPASMQWDIQEVSDEDYVLSANYGFKVGDQSFTGTTSWTKEPYRNHYAAEKAQEEFTAQNLVVWYDPSSPEHSSLQKELPLKECISAIFLWGLLLYFLWISFYVAKFKT